ncbi:MAG: DUF362 domain-containing protein [Candidatus Aureabacteria bacterium]|nr:DUF362 domain-containing protein [Candidatus Auribacterota bacterium]
MHSNISEVFLIQGHLQDFLKSPEKILGGIEKTGAFESIKKNTPVALKIHFGEKGNVSHIPPRLVSPLSKKLKELQAKPFLFETNTLYRGERMNSVDHINLAYQHGFGRLGLPIIIGDGLKGNDYTEVGIYKKHFQSCFVAKALDDIPMMIVLSHFTGHMLTGFGAALKNLGMGCASRRGKLAQHSVVCPRISPSQCIQCGACAENCPADAIERREDSFFICEEKCIGCAQCISVCPQGAVKIIWCEATGNMGEKMMEYAFAVTQKVKRCVFVNFCVFITKECDCMNCEKSGFIPDLGVLVSTDPVSLDKACVDLLVKRESRDVWKEIHPSVDYLHQMDYAQKLGLGTQAYRLVELK